MITNTRFFIQICFDDKLRISFVNELQRWRPGISTGVLFPKFHGKVKESFYSLFVLKAGGVEVLADGEGKRTSKLVKVMGVRKKYSLKWELDSCAQFFGKN